MSQRRIDKINALFMKTISEMIERDMHFDRAQFCTVTKVDTSPDMKFTKIYLSIYPETKTPSFFKRLDRKKRTLKKQLYSKLSLKIFPEIQFINDKTERDADQIEHLLQRIHNEREFTNNESNNTLS